MWKDEPATEKQLLAIRNMSHKWKLKTVPTPKTKGQAYEAIVKLKEQIEVILDEQALDRQESGDVEGDPFWYGF